MKINLTRGKIWKMEELPPRSIAIDGAVQGPHIDGVNQKFSFDHHSGCLRFCTTSACMQTHSAILLGLNPDKFQVFTNDVDLDVVLSIWCLKNPDRCSEPLVKKLVDAAGLSDMYAGAFPINGFSKTLEWISAPQTDSIRNGDYEKLSDDGLLTIMESVLHRIDHYVNGTAQLEISEQETHGEFNILKNENGWVLVESQDPHVYSSLYKSGFDRVVLIRHLDDNSVAVSLAKKSDFIEHFPIIKMYEEFNKLEPGWGGGSSCGGCVRNPDGSRSRLHLEIIIEIINACIDNREPNNKIIKKYLNKQTKPKKVKK